MNTEKKRQVKLLTVNGNVSYDYLFRSRSDTPFSQRDFQQHTEKVYLSMMIKEKFPLKLSFTLRQSNSPYFNNFADFNFQFDYQQYQKNRRLQLLNKLKESIENRPEVKKFLSLLASMEDEVSKLKNWLESPATLQKIIEEREHRFALETAEVEIKTAPGFSIENYLPSQSYNNKRLAVRNRLENLKEKEDSTRQTITKIYQDKKLAYDSISVRIKVLEKKADSIKNAMQKEFAMARAIYNTTSGRGLKKLATLNGIGLNDQNKFETKLAAVKRFGIGRSMINYSELTAQNITLSGINIEYNPSYYAAFAAGKIEYRFRDFFNKNRTNPGQYLVLGRIGTGDIERRALILTVFKGSKNNSGFTLNDTLKNQVNIIGYSIESIFKKNENTNLSFEVAKSTKPPVGNLQNTKQFDGLWKLGDQTNLGINIKAKTMLAETNTKLEGFYRKTGANFQSFSLFSYHTDQTAWLAKLSQYLLKEKLEITGMLRRNDFTNPFTDKTYKTSTVFKTILLNVRIPKYPSLSVGYYPGSQLYVVNGNLLRENAYYLMNGSLVYSYLHKGIGMNSTAVYNQYFNKATDSGFVLYKGASYYVMQTVFLRNLQIQGGYTYNKQPDLQYVTMETSADYSLRQLLKVGMGIKYNKIKGAGEYWGNRIQFSLLIRQFGSLQLQYEKSFLPTIHQELYPIEMGRVSWYKYF
ncbi:MAG: hypothetical protein ABIN94_17340 [Ferruginibacter sp.]